MDGVSIDRLAAGEIHSAHAHFITGPRQVSFLLQGDDVTVYEGWAGDRIAGRSACENAFAQFPSEPVVHPVQKSMQDEERTHSFRGLAQNDRWRSR